ncbi:hypothetical protein CC80DRAFT_588020 [Byssothecium circinans]|uniref:Uncharacterized protein n=1 Tax=Byssothecium circinans TaxID=147558 RepID=A0A6A5URE5_9PLEO|nr:hypothetical protein CC80DRAFT_588020 [Byssothecium circinans]
MAPHFLTLPGEIRNRIFEDVFTEPNGVVCVKTDKGVGVFYRYDDKMKQLHEKDAWDVATKVHKAQQENETATGDASERPNKRRKLSLKDHNEDAIAFRETEANIHYELVNSLRLVNRQLCHETRNLVIRFNDIRFLGGHRTRLEVLANFLRSCSAVQRAQIRGLTVGISAINLCKDAKNTGSSLEEINAFCTAYPKSIVTFREPAWTQKNAFFLFSALCIAVILDKGDEFAGKVMANDAAFAPILLASTLSVLMPTIDNHVQQLLVHRPCNVHIRPREETLDPDVFRKAMLREKKMAYIIDRRLGGDLECWVKLVQEIYDKGL